MKALFETWVDCRQVFQNFYGYRPQGIEGMLAEWNLPFCGRLHSGIADARNIASIVINMMQDANSTHFYPWRCFLSITRRPQ